MVDDLIGERSSQPTARSSNTNSSAPLLLDQQYNTTHNIETPAFFDTDLQNCQSEQSSLDSLFRLRYDSFHTKSGRRRPTRPGSQPSIVFPFHDLPIGPMSLDKPYHCPACDMPFYDRTKFRHHYMVHTGERPYSCNLCDFRSRQVGNLNKHIREKHSDHL